MFHIALLLLSSLCLLAQTPSTKSQKLSEIDRRIATLQSELAGLTALRASNSSGQLPNSAIAMINVASVTNPAPTALAAITPTPKPAPSSLYHLGPRGGCYTLTSGGNKRYVDRSMCQ